MLLAMAGRHGVDSHDREDVVQEAMLRAVEHADVTDDGLRAWLVVVTLRLCVDRHRRRSSENRRWQRLSGLAVVAQPDQHHEEQVCDRHEASWVACLAAELLPARQAEALQLSAAGNDVGQIASRLGVHYRAAESLLARARRTMRTALTAAALP
jgi:RNA polymerase sigma factor (sigma-70 family)